jgi:hypothetical protein
MAITIPVTSKQIYDEIIANLNKEANIVKTKKGGEINDKGVFEYTFEDKPAETKEAIVRATSDAVYTALVAILNSTSINVDGVL